jgi:uncharacterized protein YdaU (DUF1376 family)
MNGGIPNDREAINRIAGGLTDAGWIAICARLTLADGDRDGDRHGEREQRWVHPRMERERERTDTIRKARQDAAAATNRKRQDGDRHADRTADRHGERTADRGVTTTTTTDIQPPIAPPSKGGRVGKNRRDRNRDLNQPQW